MKDLHSVESDHPVFIVGAPRSGTTLMAKVLNRHSRIFMPGETHFFPDIYAQREELGSFSEEKTMSRVWGKLTTLYQRYNEPDDQARVDAILEDRDAQEHLRTSMCSYREALTAFMLVQTEREGKVRWGNNAPKDLFYFEDILDFYPGAQFVVCVRDIRGFLKSYQDKWKATADSQIGRLKKLYHPVITSLLWKSSVRRVEALKRKFSGNGLLVVRYEDMVSQPEATIKGVCEYISEDFEPQMLDINFSNSSDRQAQTGIYSVSVDSWKKKLSLEDVWIAQWLCGREMQLLGYEVKPVRPDKLRLMRVLLSTPWALARALRSNRANTGPIVPYIWRRISGLMGR